MPGQDVEFAISLSIAGQTIDAKLAAFGQQIGDLSPAFEAIGEDLLGDFAANMTMEGGLYGKTARSYLGEAAGPWKPLADSTVRERERLGYGGAHPILQRKGELRESLTIRGGVGNVFEVSPDRLRVGTSLFFAFFHQDGTQKMPARPLVGVSRQRRSAIKQRLVEFVNATVARAGFAASSSSSSSGM